MSYISKSYSGLSQGFRNAFVIQPPLWLWPTVLVETLCWLNHECSWDLRNLLDSHLAVLIQMTVIISHSGLCGWSGDFYTWRSGSAGQTSCHPVCDHYFHHHLYLYCRVIWLPFIPWHHAGRGSSQKAAEDGALHGVEDRRRQGRALQSTVPEKETADVGHFSQLWSSSFS